MEDVIGALENEDMECLLFLRADKRFWSVEKRVRWIGQNSF